MSEIDDELNELKEHAEHAALDPKMAPVSFTMALLAVVLATITLLGHRAHTHQVILQTRANDEWSYYQGKSVRRATNETVAKLMTAMDFKDKEQAAKVRESIAAEAERYRKESDEIQDKARELQNEARHENRLANRFDLGEGFLQVALVITSITLLTRRRHYWAIGGVIALAGMVVAISAAFVH
jgi:sulfur carrier protein ThiS